MADVTRTVRQNTNSGNKAAGRIHVQSSGEAWNVNPILLDAESVILASGLNTQRVILDRFNLNVPDLANVLGVQFTVNRSGLNDIFDHTVRLVKNGVVQTTDKSKAAVWVAGPSGATYGDSTDLWSDATLTPSDLNDPDFGISISVQNVNASGNIAYIKGAQATAYYGFSANNEGRALVYSDKFGHQQVVNPTLRKENDWVNHSGRLTTRFDDITYYTG
jgi:hypothetical protein